MPDPRANEVESYIKKQSTAFVREGQELQVLTCALLAALQSLEMAKPSTGIWTPSDVLATGLWSALSFQKPRSDPRLESLRTELIERSRDLVNKSSSSARNREPVPDLSLKVAEGDTWEKVTDQLKTATNRTIGVLRTNSALDREELDLLWWVLSDWSTLLSQQLSSAPPVIAAVFSGVEAAQFMRRLPNEAHKHLVLRFVDTQRTLNLAELLQELGDRSSVLASRFSENEILSACPRVFPLLSAISGRDVSGVAARIPRSLNDWAARALLESAVLHIATLTKVLV
jgi:hypothetical protein